MNIIRRASHVLIAGKSGMGKTGYGERYIIGSHHGRVFIFDHQSEFQERLGIAPCYTFEAMRERAKTERIICFDYSVQFFGQLSESFDLFCDEVFALAREHLEPAGIEGLFVCDEIQKCSTPNQCPQPLKNIVQTGRRFNLDSLMMTQQPNRISNEIREQVTELILFRLLDDNSLKFVESFGQDSAPVQGLPPLHYRWYNTVTGASRAGSIKYGPGKADKSVVISE